MTRPILIVIGLLLGSNFAAAQDDSRMLQLRGATMGTSYMVKLFDPPPFETEIGLAIDAELRRVNDQMSTYLKSSELSRFNDSTSTDWFSVSPQTAMVVEFAQGVSAKTDGAFDVTVGPLVNAWSFGPEPRDHQLPDDQLLDRLRESVGFAKLSVRLDPPALRKSIPDLRVDLSALAKGHGVDRVVDLLHSLGAANVFVEIGGEVRTSGDKDGHPWRVGIQLPDAARDAVMIAHPMSTDGGKDESMATSGDYRNYFEVNGKRYSHTIDPRTGKPVDHDLASVSVIAATCMAADAWATAINVVGPQRGLELANREQLAVLLVSRREGEYVLRGTGVLAQYAEPEPVRQPGPTGAQTSSDVGSPLIVLALSVAAFGIILFAMAIGVVFGRRAISGSCGGLSGSTNEDGSVSCSLCSNPADACKELRERMKNGANAGS